MVDVSVIKDSISSILGWHKYMIAGLVKMASSYYFGNNSLPSLCANFVTRYDQIRDKCIKEHSDFSERAIRDKASEDHLHELICKPKSEGIDDEYTLYWNICPDKLNKYFDSVHAALEYLRYNKGNVSFTREVALGFYSAEALENVLVSAYID